MLIENASYPEVVSFLEKHKKAPFILYSCNTEALDELFDPNYSLNTTIDGFSINISDVSGIEELDEIVAHFIAFDTNATGNNCIFVGCPNDSAFVIYEAVDTINIVSLDASIDTILKGIKHINSVTNNSLKHDTIKINEINPIYIKPYYQIFEDLEDKYSTYDNEEAEKEFDSLNLKMQCLIAIYNYNLVDMFNMNLKVNYKSYLSIIEEHVLFSSDNKLHDNMENMENRINESFYELFGISNIDSASKIVLSFFEIDFTNQSNKLKEYIEDIGIDSVRKSLFIWFIEDAVRSIEDDILESLEIEDYIEERVEKFANTAKCKDIIHELLTITSSNEQ